MPPRQDVETSPRVPSLRSGRHRIRHILVGLDHSARSEVCLPYAVAVARTFGSAITLVHVLEGADQTDALGWELARREARAYLERKEREVSEASGQRVAVRVEEGHPAERITALAREVEADLTVLGSHGAAGLTTWRRGSTTQQVVAVAEGSVLIAPSARALPAVVEPRRILVPLDGSLRSESVLPTVARMALAHDAELLLAHVVLEPVPSEVLREAEDLELARELGAHLEVAAARYLAGVRDQLAAELASVRTFVVRSTDPRQTLLELSAREGADLIVLSAHGTVCNPARPFGSVTAYLLTYSPLPILVLQDLSEGELQQATEAADGAAPPLRASFTPELH